jgi:hypothetical protein
MDLVKKEVKLEMNCHHIGTIQTFNAATQTAYISINYTKTIFEYNSTSNSYVPVNINYPPSTNAPVVVLGGGPAWLNLPISPGDECILLFNDRDMSNWYSSGQVNQPVSTARFHGFADAVALVGLKSAPNARAAYDAIRAVLTNGNVMVGINPGSNKATIKNTSNGTLGASLTIILNALQTFLQTSSSATTAPQIATAAGTFNSAITTAVTNIEGLLE